jgi:starch phosphorylase
VGRSLCADLGWALGDGQEHGSDPAWDAAEAEALYERLEREVIPEFYTRNEKGIPTAWVARMRESMARIDPALLRRPHRARIHRGTLSPGGERLPIARGQQRRIGRQMVDWRHSLEQKWAALHFGAVKVETATGNTSFEVQVGLHGLDPKAVRVELYADGIKDSPPVRQEMTCFTHWRTNQAATFTARLCPRPARQRTIRRE